MKLFISEKLLLKIINFTDMVLVVIFLTAMIIIEGIGFQIKNMGLDKR